MRLYDLLNKLGSEERVKIAYLPAMTVNELLGEKVYKKIWFGKIKFVALSLDKSKIAFLNVVLTNQANKKTFVKTK